MASIPPVPSRPYAGHPLPGPHAQIPTFYGPVFSVPSTATAVPVPVHPGVLQTRQHWQMYSQQHLYYQARAPPPVHPAHQNIAATYRTVPYRYVQPMNHQPGMVLFPLSYPSHQIPAATSGPGPNGVWNSTSTTQHPAQFTHNQPAMAFIPPALPSQIAANQPPPRPYARTLVNGPAVSGPSSAATVVTVQASRFAQNIPPAGSQQRPACTLQALEPPLVPPPPPNSPAASEPNPVRNKLRNGETVFGPVPIDGYHLPITVEEDSDDTLEELDVPIIYEDGPYSSLDAIEEAVKQENAARARVLGQQKLQMRFSKVEKQEADALFNEFIDCDECDH